jgi:NAD(P)H-nitrite reductase large subunit
MDEHLVIIGNGITGTTVARNVRKENDMKITVISNETEYFFSRTALMYIYMGHMEWKNIKPYEDWFWEKNDISLIFAEVTSIDTENKRITLDNDAKIDYNKLLIASGSKSNKFGWQGQDLPGVQGLYSKQDVNLLEENTKNVKEAVIVGGGLIGIELGEMLHSRGIHVTFLVREKYYWNSILPDEEAILVSRHILEMGLDIRLGTQMKEVLAGNDGRVRAVLTDQGEEIVCQFVGLTPGVHPNIDLLKNTKIETNRGVLVNEYLETNIPDIYSAGDCAEIRSSNPNEKNKIEQLWYTGKMQADAVSKTILGKRTAYDRGVNYNSAKFLDIEYQTYGSIFSKLREGESAFYWEHESHKKCIKIVYKSDNRTVIGINLFGIRMRHQVWDKWIKNKKTIEFVLEHLEEANFDPEFYKKHEKEIISKFNNENPGENIKLNKRKTFYKMFVS